VTSLLDSDDHREIIACVRAGLAALERGDEVEFRVQVDALVSWHTQPLVQGLIRLARELGQAFGEPDSTNSLPEACARLEHAVRMSEDASHRTMDLIDQCRDLLVRLPAAPGSDEAEAVAGLRVRFSEITAAQGYQDLTGQIILRVVDIVRSVQNAGGGAESGARPLHLPNASPSHGFGPSVKGIDPAPAAQDDADELLSSLGL
jgi:chemotaxis protein CheZ